MERAVSGQVNDALSRDWPAVHRWPHRVEAHRPQSAAGDKPFGFGVMEKLSRLHLVLSHVRHIDVRPGQFEILSINDRGPNASSAAGRDAHSSFQPRISRATSDAKHLFTFSAMAESACFKSQRSAISNFYVFIQFAPVCIDVDDLGRVRKFSGIQRDPVGEAHADSQQQIATIHGKVGGHRSVHADHAQIQRVVMGYDTGPPSWSDRRGSALLRQCFGPTGCCPKR